MENLLKKIKINVIAYLIVNKRENIGRLILKKHLKSKIGKEVVEKQNEEVIRIRKLGESKKTYVKHKSNYQVRKYIL